MRLSVLPGLLCLCLAEAAGVPPHLTLDDLAFLAGRWVGTLEYLDYADNRTRQTLQASLDCTRGDGALEYRFTYVEPNGTPVEGDEVRVTLDEDGTRLRLNEETWRVMGKAIDPRQERYEVVLSRDGVDADRPAEFRRTLTLDEATLVIRTEVRPEGEERWFVRNEHILTGGRDGPGPTAPTPHAGTAGGDRH